MTWDWSTAGHLRRGKPDREHDAQGNLTYASIKGTFTWQRDVRPDYVWFDGTAGHYLLGDHVESSNPIAVNTLYGRYDEPDAKIVPVKVHRANQIYDPVTMMLIQPKLFAPNAPQIGRVLEGLRLADGGRGGNEIGRAAVQRPLHLRPDLSHAPAQSHGGAEKSARARLHPVSRAQHSRLAGLSDVYLPGRDRNRVVYCTAFRAAGDDRVPRCCMARRVRPHRGNGGGGHDDTHGRVLGIRAVLALGAGSAHPVPRSQRVRGTRVVHVSRLRSGGALPSARRGRIDRDSSCSPCSGI